MVTTAIAAAGALAAAGGAYASATNGAAANKAQAQASNNQFVLNRTQQINDALQAALANQYNQQQLRQDQANYERAYLADAQQRDLLNRRSVASTADAVGNTTYFDPASNTWRVRQEGLAATNRDRGITAGGADYITALTSRLVDEARARTRRTENAGIQSKERAAADSYARQLTNTAPRNARSVEDAMIAANVANTMDPLREAESNATIQSIRQGSGMQALTGALARSGRTGTQAAIANARLDAPARTASEKASWLSGITEPLTPLQNAGNAPSDAQVGNVPTNDGSSLLAAISRNAPGGMTQGTSIQRSNLAAAQKGTMLNYQPFARNSGIGSMAEAGQGLATTLGNLYSQYQRRQQPTVDNWTTFSGTSPGGSLSNPVATDANGGVLSGWS